MPIVFHAGIGGLLFAPESSVLSSLSLSPGILKNSSRVELECGTTPAGRRKSSSSRREVFDGPLSGQSVYEQSSGVLLHTESVRGDKVQEQD